MSFTLTQINNAIKSLCYDVEERVSFQTWHEMTENELLCELFICLLGSSVNYEMAVSYSKKLVNEVICNKKVLLNNENYFRIIQYSLSTPTYNTVFKKTFNSYRFPNKGARYISNTLNNLKTEFGTIKEMLDSIDNSNDLRKALINSSLGIGPKQASHFIRNIGFSDKIAIIDRHIIKYLKLYNDNLIKKLRINKLQDYEILEDFYLQKIKNFSFPVSIIDQATWFIMREVKGSKI